MRRYALISLLLLGSTLARASDIYCEKDLRDCSDRPRPGAILFGASAPKRDVDNGAADSGSAGATGNPAPAKAAPASSAAASPSPPVDPVAAQRAEDASKAALQKDLNAKRAEQCKEAKTKYQTAIDARRLFRTDEKGNRVYLSDTETDAARLNARKAMDEVCGQQ